MAASYEQFSIPVKAKNPEAAKAFLKFLYSDESIQAFAKYSNTVYALKDARETCKEYLSEGMYNMLSAYDNAVALPTAMSTLPQGCKIDVNKTLYHNHFTEVINGTMSVKDWLDSIETTLQKYGQIGKSTVMSRKGSLVCTGRLPFQILGVQKNKKQGVLVYERRIKKERKFAQNIYCRIDHSHLYFDDHFYHYSYFAGILFIADQQYWLERSISVCGLDNYIYMFRDDQFVQSLWNSIKLMAVVP